MYTLKIIQRNSKIEFSNLELPDCIEVIEKLKASNMATRFYVTRLTKKAVE